MKKKTANRMLRAFDYEHKWFNKQANKNGTSVPLELEKVRVLLQELDQKKPHLDKSS